MRASSSRMIVKWWISRLIECKMPNTKRCLAQSSCLLLGRVGMGDCGRRWRSGVDRQGTLRREKFDIRQRLIVMGTVLKVASCWA